MYIAIQSFPTLSSCCVNTDFPSPESAISEFSTYLYQATSLWLVHPWLCSQWTGSLTSALITIVHSTNQRRVWPVHIASKMAGRTFSVLSKLIALIALLKLLPVLFCNGSLKLTPESIFFCERPEIAVLHHPTLSFGPFYFINFHAVLTSVKARSNSCS